MKLSAFAARRGAVPWLLGLLAAASPALASRTDGGPAPGADPLATFAQAAPCADPLLPFRVAMDITPEALRHLARTENRGQLRAPHASYTHVSLDAAATGSLPAPGGWSVEDGDFYFRDGRQLVEANLVVRTPAEGDAVTELSRWLGEPDFSVALPGAEQRMAGWRTPHGFLLGTFSDLPLVRLCAFDARTGDALAASQQLLYDGLARFAGGLAKGDKAALLLPDLLDAVARATSARAALRSAP